MITIMKYSPITKFTSEMQVNCTEEQYADYKAGNGFIQDCLPQATVDQREFVMTGILPGEWDAIFANEEGDE